MQGSRAGNILVCRSGSEGRLVIPRQELRYLKKTRGILAWVNSVLTWRALASCELFCLRVGRILQSLQD